MAQTIKLKRSATPSAVPSTSSLALGEVAINTNDGKMYIKKSVGGTESIVEIGGSGSSSVSYLEAGMIEYEYTATSNQTTFSGSDSNSATLSYTANSIMVFLNGVLQDDGVDYTATNGTSVVFTSALTANDEVRIVAIDTVASTGSLQNPTKLDAITTVNGQAAYSLTVNSSAYTPSSQNALIVSLNGITQEPGDSFTISGSTITFSPALVTGDVIDYIVDMGRAVTIGQYDSDLVVSGELEVTGDIIGDLRGAILFKAQAGENLTKCDAVYISGISGNTTVVSKADADDANKMPAFGIVAASATSGQPVDIYTFGTLSGVDTSTPGWSIGDELYVSTTPGALTNSAPTGESTGIQKIGKVTRVDSSSGSIKIMGAGRSNATPNLNDGNIFIGNASNQVSTATLDTSIVPENGNLYFTTARVDSHLSGGTGVTYNAGEISIGQDVSTTATPTFGNITTTGYIAGPSTFTIDPAAVGDNTGTLVVAGNLQVDGTTTTINSTTMTVDDLNITLASGAANAAAANGAGITVDGASASLTYNSTPDAWSFNKNLGIGTTTVNADLHLGAASPHIDIGPAAGNRGKVGFDSNNVYIGSTSGTGEIHFKNNIGSTDAPHSSGDTKMVIADGGVGIGTDSPARILHIEKDGLADLLLRDTSTYSVGTGPAVIFQGNDSGSTITQFGAIYGVSNGSNSGELKFETRNSGSSAERMRIDSAGDVGIGTSDLSVYNALGSSRDFVVASGGTTTVTVHSGTTNYGHLAFADGTSTANDEYRGLIQYYHGDNSMRFYSNAVQRMLIDSVGDIYIGNNGSAATRVVEISGTNTGTNPAANGHVAGDLRLRNVSATDNNHSAISWYNSNNAVDSRITGVHKSHSSRYGEIAFLTHDGSALGERMRIGSTGSVGIATTNPATKLEVAHTTTGIANNISVYNSNTAASAECAVDWALERTGSAAKIRAARITAGKEQTWTTTPSTVDGYLKFLTVKDESLNEAMRIDSSGNVGIGVSSLAGDKLEVSGSIRQTGTSPYPIKVLSTSFVYYPHYNTAHIAYYKRAVHPANSNQYHYYWRTSDSGAPGGANENTHMILFTGSSTAGRLYVDDGITFSSSAAAAQTLDDYEEGTFTPSFTTSGTLTVNSATYTKIGRQVTCRFYLSASTTCSGDITGLPFTPNGESAGVVGYQTHISGETIGILVQAANVWNLRIGQTQYGLAAGKQIRGMFTYFTDA